MLGNAIEHCPDKIWNKKNDFSDFWYIAYHTIFWLDFYLSDNPDEFSSHNNFGMTEHDPKGILPGKVYTKTELQSYLNHCKVKCKNVIANIKEEDMHKQYSFFTLKMPFYELLLYNMRHVQHHTAQLNMILRQEINYAPKWVRRENE